MAITINGSSNTVTGLAVGGLPDNTIDNGSMADDAIGVAELSATGTASSSTYLSGDNSWAALTSGLTEADNWRITADFSGDADPISSNLERVDGTLQPSTQLGSGMSVSSGVWTFPSTGYWYVTFYHTFWKDGSTRYIESYISSTADNGSAWDHRIGFAQTHITQSSGDTFGSQIASTLLDITDTSNHKIRFGTAAGSAVTTYGSSTDSRTHFIFMKLGDT